MIIKAWTVQSYSMLNTIRVPQVIFHLSWIFSYFNSPAWSSPSSSLSRNKRGELLDYAGGRIHNFCLLTSRSLSSSLICVRKPPLHFLLIAVVHRKASLHNSLHPSSFKRTFTLTTDVGGFWGWSTRSQVGPNWGSIIVSCAHVLCWFLSIQSGIILPPATNNSVRWVWSQLRLSWDGTKLSSFCTTFSFFLFHYLFPPK